MSDQTRPNHTRPGQAGPDYTIPDQASPVLVTTEAPYISLYLEPYTRSRPDQIRPGHAKIGQAMPEQAKTGQTRTDQANNRNSCILN